MVKKILEEVLRRQDLLVHQNTGRWSMKNEHDRRTMQVLETNRALLKRALKEIEALELIENTP